MSGTEIILQTPAAFDPRELAGPFAAVLAAGPVSACLMWLADDDPDRCRGALDVLLPVAHSCAVPLLVAGYAGVPGGKQADGVHLEAPLDALGQAIAGRTGERSVGAGGIFTRHGAMEAGEADVDYVFFGTADPAREAENEAPRLLDLAEWWSDLFQIPCVAPARTEEEAAALAEAGADFIALRDAVWRSDADPAAALARLARAVGGPEAAR